MELKWKFGLAKSLWGAEYGKLSEEVVHLGITLDIRARAVLQWDPKRWP